LSHELERDRPARAPRIIECHAGAKSPRRKSLWLLVVTRTRRVPSKPSASRFGCSKAASLSRPLAGPSRSTQGRESGSGTGQFRTFRTRGVRLTFAGRTRAGRTRSVVSATAIRSRTIRGPRTPRASNTEGLEHRGPAP
jgi:hypothetical protein